jgi:hypothetical protein
MLGKLSLSYRGELPAGCDNDDKRNCDTDDSSEPIWWLRRSGKGNPCNFLSGQDTPMHHNRKENASSLPRACSNITVITMLPATKLAVNKANVGRGEKNTLMYHAAPMSPKITLACRGE